MKKEIIFLFTCLFLFNCNNKQLENKVRDLELINKSLLDSIKKMNYNKLTSSEMIILPSKNSKGIRFDGMVYNQLKGFKYNLYQLDTLHYVRGVNKKLIFKDYTFPQFQIDVDKKLIKKQTLYLVAEYDLDSLKIHVPGIFNLGSNE